MIEVLNMGTNVVGLRGSGVAVVTDDNAIAGAFHLFGPLMPCETCVFALSDQEKAAAWISES